MTVHVSIIYELSRGLLQPQIKIFPATFKHSNLPYNDSFPSFTLIIAKKMQGTSPGIG